MHVNIDDAAMVNSAGSVHDGALRTRFISGTFIGIVTIGAGLLGGWWFTGLVFAVFAIAAYEAVILMRVCGFKPSLVFSFLSFSLAFITVRLPNLPNLPLLITILLLTSLAWQMRHRSGKPIADSAIGLLIGVYLGWTGGHLAAVRELDHGIWWLVIAIGITWLADSGAYIVGKRYGIHQLAPSISPKKTWEGYFGGVAVAALGGLLIGLISPLGMLHSVIAAVLVGALGTLGDLTESLFKRQANAKDSSNLIPGHGGAFDRIDSLVWAGVIIFYYATVFYR